MRIPIQLHPHPEANESDMWTLMFFIGKALEADCNELRLKFVERVKQLNDRIERLSVVRSLD